MKTSTRPRRTDRRMQQQRGQQNDLQRGLHREPHRDTQEAQAHRLDDGRDDGHDGGRTDGRNDDHPAARAFDLAEWVARTASVRERSRQFNELSTEELHELSEQAGRETFGQAVASLSKDTIGDVLKTFDARDVAGMVRSLTAYQAAELLRRIRPHERDLVLEALPDTIQDRVEETLRWDEETVGGNMTPDFFSVAASMTTDETLRTLRSAPQSLDSYNYLYLNDEHGRLVGVVSINQLIAAPADATLADIGTRSVQSVRPDTDREVAAELLNDHRLTALPVALDGRVLGVLTADRAAEILVEETTEDFARMSSSRGRNLNVRRASVWMLYRSRVFWLVVLVFGNLLSGAGIAHYEDLIQDAVSLVFFLPLLIDSGGNAGSQAATLMVRGIATGDVALRDWFTFLLKEVSVAALLGISMALAVSLVGFWRGGPTVALVVALTMIAVVLVGSAVGMSLPFILSKLRMDPAGASAPLVTTICDTLGVFIYFFIASQFIL